MIFFDSLCSLIRAVSTLMKYYVQLRWRERERESEREREWEWEWEWEKKNMSINKIKWYMFFPSFGGAESVGRPRKVVQILQTYKIFPGCQWEQAVHVYRCHMMPLGVQQQLIPNKCSTHILGRRADTDTTYDFVTLLHLVSPCRIHR